MLPAATIRTAIEERLFAVDTAAEPIRWAPATGGLSEAAVWRVERGDAVFAVRRWWKGIDPHYVAWIAATLSQAAASGLEFIAVPLAEGDAWPFRDASSGRWEAVPWKPGRSLDETPNDGSAVAAAVEGLVAFHRRTRDRGGCPADACSAFSDRAKQLRSMAAPRPSVERGLVESFPELPRIARRLPSAAHQASQLLAPWIDAPAAVQPIHGDARPEHFLLEADELTGLIDFGAMRVDTPLADLARLAGELAAGDAACRDSLVEAYGEAAGIAADRRAVGALDFSGAVLSGANWLRWFGQPGGSERDPKLVRQRLRSILARLDG